MKKILALALALAMIFVVVACGNGDNGAVTSPPPAGNGGGGEQSPPPAGNGGGGEQSPPPGGNGEEEDPPVDDGRIRLALVTDYGTIDDGSFNQGSWEGMVAYALEHGISHQYIQPAEVSDAAYVDAIELAVIGGAELIVTPGFLFAAAVYEAQALFPDVAFVLIDSVPRGPDGPYVAQNTVGVLYAEEESGFLAGYSAVLEGHRELGFIGGIAVPAVVRFGTGFVEGAEYAANELGLAAGEITIRYTYAGTFSPSPDVQTMAAAWYMDGVEIIFAAAGGAGFSVFAAAEAANALAIGVDIDQSGASETVITSALKGLQASVYQVIEDFYNGRFPGGQEKIFNAALDGVGLPMATSRFQNFTNAQYDAIFARLASGAINLSTTIGADAHMNLNISLVELIDI